MLIFFLICNCRNKVKKLCEKTTISYPDAIWQGCQIHGFPTGAVHTSWKTKNPCANLLQTLSPLSLCFCFPLSWCVHLPFLWMTLTNPGKYMLHAKLQLQVISLFKFGLAQFTQLFSCRKADHRFNQAQVAHQLSIWLKLDRSAWSI